jgi:DNA (cytosine-5)-methyltransferase 1
MGIRIKIERIKGGETPRVLDLFAGCGGISLGFDHAGFQIVGAVEIDPDAARTHALNFCKGEPEEIVEIHGKARDIVTLEPEDFVKDLGLEHEDIENIVDVIVGGPPCQAFTRVGRAKLREIAEHPEAYLQDPRSNLYLRYIEYVKKFKPLAILIENVPDILNFGGENVAEQICEVLDSLGYSCRYTLLNTVYYGVPQMRERMFLVAYLKELNVEVTFPEPTHWADLPQGYHNSRKVALKTLKNDLFKDELSKYYTPVRTPEQNLKKAVTAYEALSDLPVMNEHLVGLAKRGARRFTELIKYKTTRNLNEYATYMRNWKCFEGGEGIKDHVIRSLPRDYKIFAQMKPGDQYPQAFEAATALFKKYLVDSGLNYKESSIEYNELKATFVPPYDPKKFPNKWRKMEPDMPARTLMAHLGKDTYSHIHYDSKQARTISVREAARLQSFPDGFIFSGTMNPAFKQIGNSVPPLMSFAIASEMYNKLINAINVEKTSCQTVDAI